MTTVEDRRHQLQKALDAAKSQGERNVLGQFSTPFSLAKDIVGLALNLCNSPRVTELLEPACGTGVFFSALQSVCGKDRLDGSIGFELDSHYAIPSAEMWKDYGVRIICEDFLAQQPFRKFPLLIANPPYSRHHHIESGTKQKLQELVLKQTGIKLSGLSGLYCYFMLLSTQWLQADGLSCWLVPSEFMDVNYGEAVKQYLTERVDLLRIHRFDESDLQFNDALVSSSVVFFRNAQPSNHPVDFTFSGTLGQPLYSYKIERRLLDKKRKWNQLFTKQDEDDNTPHQILGDFFEVKRGIATGCNDFFIIDEAVIKEYDIPAKYLTPILPSPRIMKSDKIESVNGIPIVEKPLFLFSADDDISTIQSIYPGVARYIKKGEERKVHETYICSRHTPWYSCEKRKSSPFVIPYMGRGDTGRQMFRFILNESDAIATNGYLLLYPQKQYEYLFRDRHFLHTVWEELKSIPMSCFEQQGRFYGGGLHKMEPRELLKLPAHHIGDCFADFIKWIA